MTALTGGLDVISELVAKMAPELANAVLGPIGGTVVGLIASAFGLKHSESAPLDSKELESKLLSDPEAAVKLKQLELSVRELEVKHDALSVQDVESARAYDVQSKHEYVLPVLAVIYTVAFLSLLLLDALHFTKIIDTYAQHLYSIALIIVNFYFGASFKRG